MRSPCIQRFRSLVRQSGTRCLTNSEIRRVVLTVLSSFLRQSCLVFTNVTRALEVFLNVMRYINPRFTYLHLKVLIIMTRSDQPKPPAVAIVHQNGLSSASSRASVADAPVSRQIWWTQVVDGRPQARLHSCDGRSPSLVLVQILRIRFAGTSLRSLAT